MSSSSEDPGVRGEEIARFMIALASESERSAVVLGASRLDVAARRALERVLVAPARKEPNILDTEQPLGTFAARIRMLEGLGLCNRSFAACLHHVRKTRNDFAHSVTLLHLTEIPFCDRIRDIRTRMDCFQNAPRAFFDLLLEANMSSELREYCTAISQLVVMLEMAALTNQPPTFALRLGFRERTR